MDGEGNRVEDLQRIMDHLEGLHCPFRHRALLVETWRGRYPQEGLRTLVKLP